MKNKKNICERITEKFLTALKEGRPPWVKPWNAEAGFPVNATTEAQYQGTNIVMLWMSATANGFASDRWLTFRQARKAGGHVRRGEKSTPGIYCREKLVDKKVAGEVVVDANGEPVKTKFVFFRAFSLFNVEQCDDLPEEVVQGKNPTASLPLDEKFQAADRLVEDHAIVIQRGGHVACYDSVRNRIHLPNSGTFDSTENYYSTLLHEVVHWSGHEDRLNRPGIANRSSRGSKDYAFEELVAEIGSAFMCAEFGITGELRHEEYVNEWCKILSNDANAVVSASSQAWQARNYLLRAED